MIVQQQPSLVSADQVLVSSPRPPEPPRIPTMELISASVGDAAVLFGPVKGVGRGARSSSSTGLSRVDDGMPSRVLEVIVEIWLVIWLVNILRCFPEAVICRIPNGIYLTVSV